MGAVSISGFLIADKLADSILYVRKCFKLRLCEVCDFWEFCCSRL